MRSVSGEISKNNSIVSSTSQLRSSNPQWNLFSTKQSYNCLSPASFLWFRVRKPIDLPYWFWKKRRTYYLLILRQINQVLSFSFQSIKLTHPFAKALALIFEVKVAVVEKAFCKSFSKRVQVIGVSPILPSIPIENNQT